MNARTGSARPTNISWYMYVAGHPDKILKHDLHAVHMGFTLFFKSLFIYIHHFIVHVDLFDQSECFFSLVVANASALLWGCVNGAVLKTCRVLGHLPNQG